MTSTPQTHRPNRVRPRTIQNRIQWVLGQHGVHVNDQTIEAIWRSLTTGDDPRPDGVPARLRIYGVELEWPSGVGRRIIMPHERNTLNEVFRRGNNPRTSTKNEAWGEVVLDSETTAEEARRAYLSLVHRAHHPEHVDPYTTNARMTELMQEACEPVPCEDTHTWNDTEPVKIQRVTNNKRSIKAQPREYVNTTGANVITDGTVDYPGLTPKPTNELDDLLAQLTTLTNQAH